MITCNFLSRRHLLLLHTGKTHDTKRNDRLCPQSHSKDSNSSGFLFVLFSRGRKTSSISVRNKRKPRPCSKAAVTRACDDKFHSLPFTQISFGFITLCQSLSCDILCLDRPSLSSKWPWTKSNSLLLPRVRFDINALSLNIQISRSCSNRLCLNLPREFRYCNGSEFEFPSWINKPLFGSKAIVSRYPFMDIWDTKQRALSLNLISFSWYAP